MSNCQYSSVGEGKFSLSMWSLQGSDDNNGYK